ncbi:LysR family transcriptional regulator [Terrilactibacillus sp. S3-3]|nr:LysR family transcriptional regulator [Terrilactibacillus sp. S3-3]
MDMRVMEYVLAVYRRNFTQAAQALHIAQPSLSNQVAKLERELGLALFDRGHGSIEPTPDGLYFIYQAEKILMMRDELLRDMNERRQGNQGDLYIGSTAVTGGHVLPARMQRYKEAYPDVNIHLTEASSEQLAGKVLDGTIDLAILALPVEDERLADEPLLTEPLYIVLPEKDTVWLPESVGDQHRPAGRLSLEVLAECPFIVLKEGYGFRRTVFDLCSKSGFQPQIAYETSSIETAQSLVGCGFGVTIVPKMAAHLDDPKNVWYTGIATLATRTLAFVYRRGRLRKTAEAFIQM